LLLLLLSLWNTDFWDAEQLQATLGTFCSQDSVQLETGVQHLVLAERSRELPLLEETQH